jgi:hypothetical protein
VGPWGQAGPAKPKETNEQEDARSERQSSRMRKQKQTEKAATGETATDETATGETATDEIATDETAPSDETATDETAPSDENATNETTTSIPPPKSFSEAFSMLQKAWGQIYPHLKFPLEHISVFPANKATTTPAKNKRPRSDSLRGE